MSNHDQAELVLNSVVTPNKILTFHETSDCFASISMHGELLIFDNNLARKLAAQFDVLTSNKHNKEIDMSHCIAKLCILLLEEVTKKLHFTKETKAKILYFNKEEK